MRTGKILFLVTSLFSVHCQITIAQTLSDFLFDVSNLLDFCPRGCGQFERVRGASGVRPEVRSRKSVSTEHSGSIPLLAIYLK